MTDRSAAAGAGTRDAGDVLLVVDTATTHAVVALGRLDGSLLAERQWIAGYRHGEELLARTEALLRDEAVGLDHIAGLVVGTGPGAFTGLRVGMATAKALAHALGVPLVGVPTASALLAAAEAPGMLVQPAGPSDLVLTRDGEPSRIVPGGEEPDLRAGERLVAVDLAGRAPAEAVRAGDTAHKALATSLVALGSARLRAGDADDLATLAPEYVTLPRGVRGAPAGDAVTVTGGGVTR